MNITEIKTLLEKEVPVILRDSPDFKTWLQNFIRSQTVSPESFDERFDRILREMAEDRQEQRRKWEQQKAADQQLREEQNRKWEEQKAADQQLREEQNRKWEAQKVADQQLREEQNRKWEAQKVADQQLREEQNRKWEEQKAADQQLREEQNRKWEEQKAADQQLREEQNRKWEEQKAADQQLREEQSRKWEAQNRKWEAQKAADQQLREEQNRKWEAQNRKWEAQRAEDKQYWDDRMLKIQAQWDAGALEFQQYKEEQRQLQQDHDREMSRLSQTVGAMGSRWGLASEEAFRSALAGILEKSFAVQVLNINEFDQEGIVFGRPDQVEMDIIIRNGTLILMELKSSMSKGDMHLFDRKCTYYEKHHQRRPDRKIVISPMVDPKALQVAQRLGIEVFTYAEDIHLT
jgi:hypothetical protein